MADPCYLCGLPSETWDHIEPRRRRTDRNRHDNRARTCYRCNHEKGSSVLIVFLARRMQRRRGMAA